MKISYLIFFVITLFCSSVKATHQEFNEKSLAKIKTVFNEQPFLLVVWSTSCPPCIGELKLLGELKKHYKNFNLVLITPDSIENKQALNKVLAEYQLSQVLAFAFSNQNQEESRYLLDPNWFGEMPRSYFYNAQHQRKAVSGRLSEEDLKLWLKINR